MNDDDKNLSSSASWFIFGAGNGGVEVLNALETSVRIEAFVDNNSRLHGKTVRDVPIVPPSYLLSKAQPRILIASMYATAISNQLLQMGIPGCAIYPICVNPIQNRIATDLRAVGLPTRELSGFPRTYKMQYRPVSPHA